MAHPTMMPRMNRMRLPLAEAGSLCRICDEGGAIVLRLEGCVVRRMCPFCDFLSQSGHAGHTWMTVCAFSGKEHINPLNNHGNSFLTRCRREFPAKIGNFCGRDGF